MKSLLLSISIFLGFLMLSEAREPIWTDYIIPRPNAYVTEGVYYSTHVNISASTTAAIISTYPAIIECVVIASGTPNSRLDIYDTNIATDTPGIRNVFGWSLFNNQLTQPAQFNVYCASGIGISNVGPVDAYIYWREK